MNRQPFSPKTRKVSPNDNLVSAVALDVDLAYCELSQQALDGILEQSDPGRDPKVRDSSANLHVDALTMDYDQLLKNVSKLAPGRTVAARAAIEELKGILLPGGDTERFANQSAKAAQKLEDLMIRFEWSHKIRVEIACMVARLTDSAIFRKRALKFDGLSANMATRLVWDPRLLTGGLVRIGVLSEFDPRVRLSDEALVPFVNADIAQLPFYLCNKAHEVMNRLMVLPSLVYSRPEVQHRIDTVIATMEEGVILESEEGVRFLREVACIAEAIGLNLHLIGKAERARVDFFLAMSAFILHKMSNIAYALKWNHMRSLQ